VLEKAATDLSALERSGVDGVLVENSADRPFRLVARPETVAVMTRVVRELEEWSHEQHLLTGPDLPSVLIAADGVTADRLQPTARAAVGLGAPLARVLAEGADLGVEAAAVWSYPSGVLELLSPILTKVPLELVAYSLATNLDRRPFVYNNPVRRQINEQTI
jgi:hypothetical protein